MKDEIFRLFYSPEPICEEGRMFLADRFLSIPHAIKSGVRSANGHIYFFFTLNGQPVRWKSRCMKDKKIQRFNKVEDDKVIEIPFFSQFKDPRSHDLIITEGEFDCVALRALGGLNVVSLPNGASSVEKAFKSNYEFIQQFETIYIAFDMDKPGEEAARKAMSLMKPSKYRRIYFPCKDANDWIKSNPELTNDDLNILMLNARKVEDPAFTDMSELPDNFYSAVDLGISSGWSDLDRIMGGFRRGEITVVTADTGSGKSTFCMNLFKNLADNRKGVWLNSYEMSPVMTNRKMASLVLRKKMKFENFSNEDRKKYEEWMKERNCKLNISNAVVNIDVLRNFFETASLAYGVNYILLDHLDYIYSNGKRKTTLENIDEAMRELHVLAMQFNVGVVLVVHPKQMEQGREISLNDLKGSSSIKQYADNIIIVTRMDRLDSTAKNKVRVRVAKNRLCGVESFFHLKYLSDSDSYEEFCDVSYK